MNLMAEWQHPTTSEINQRKDKLVNLMLENAVDAIVIADPHNIYWLTHFANYVHERPFILIMDTKGALTFVVPYLEVAHVERRKVGELKIVTYEEFPCPEKTSWKAVFEEHTKQYSKIALEGSCPLYISNFLKEKGDLIDLVEEARYEKSEYEINRIVYSSKIATRAMEKLLTIAKPGMSAISSHKKIVELIQLQLFSDNPEVNALATDIGVIVQPPSVSDDPHNFTNLLDMDMTEGGPHVSIINGVFNGYGTEVERTFFLGSVPKKALRPFMVMMEARELCFELLKPGITMHEVDSRIKEHLKMRGYGDNLLHRTGHSIGVTGHEGPFLATNFHKEIKPNMLFTVEPGIYIPGLGGFRHSDTVLVTETQNINLTPVKDSLEDMTLPIKRLNFSLSPKNKQKLLNKYNHYFGLGSQ